MSEGGSSSKRRPSGSGFTLLEVMIALALLGLALTVLIKSAAGSIFNAEQAHMMGIATDLARGKMYDIEEKLLKEGFTDTDQSECDKDFSDEGWSTVKWCDKVEIVEMPAWDELQQLALGHAKNMGSGSAGSGSAFGSAFGSGSGSSGLGSATDPLSNFQNSALGGMLGMFGMFGGAAGGAKSVTGAQGGALIQQQYTLFQQILKVSVRKVSLTVKWQVLGSDRDLKVVAFFTDPVAMDKVLSGLGAVDLDENGNAPGTGSGSGSGSGSGKPKTTTTTPTTGGR